MEPLSFLQIEPTTRCNFTCGFCAGRAMKQADLPFERFEAALATFPDLRHVELQGEGESLMHPRFLDMVEAARARGIRVSFITNGSYFTPAAIGRLLDAGIEKISVSIESPDPAEFQRIRGGKLEKVLRGVEALVGERRARGLDRPVVGLSVTVLASTQDRLGEIVALYRRLGLDGGITLQPLQRMASYTEAYRPEMAAEALAPEEVEQAWIRFRANREMRRIAAERPPVAGFFDELMEGWSPTRRSCPWLDRGLYLNNEGFATACCMVKDARFSFGRLGEASAEAILDGRAKMRAELARGEVPAACNGCDIAHYATMSKPALALVGIKGLAHRWFGKLPERPAKPASP